MYEQSLADNPPEQPKWQQIGSLERRVLGVLVEKAKTTPEAYPLSLNAIVTAANQKNNRDPVMSIDAERVEPVLERLRTLGAISEVQGGRVPRYRHYMYEWLGVDKVELAVMAELMLRGPQTEGELRGRAARMEPIADLTALRPVLASLKSKSLVIELTPPGRGAVVTHALYEPRELEKLRANLPAAGDSAGPSSSHAISPSSHGTSAPASQRDEAYVSASHASAGHAGVGHATAVHANTGSNSSGAAQASDEQRERLEQLEAELVALRSQLMLLEDRLDRLEGR